MTIKNIYISDDGEEFETEEECVEYEKARDVKGAILMFDSDRQILDDADSVKAFENAMYLYVIDVERAKKFFDFVEGDYGYVVPDEVVKNGLYVYDDNVHCQSYYELTDRIAELEVARDELLDRAHEKLGARWMGLEKGWVYDIEEVSE